MVVTRFFAIFASIGKILVLAVINTETSFVFLARIYMYFCC